MTTLVLATLVACTAFQSSTPKPVPTPTLMPLPSELAKDWRLVEQVIDGETRPPFAEGLWIEISSTCWDEILCDRCNGCIEYDAGENSHTRGLEVTDSGRFSINFHGTFMSTLEKCTYQVDPETGEKVTPCVFPEQSKFRSMLRSVGRYELREGRLWLYYAEGKPYALVFR